jgi:serine/threonine-protein kinase
VTGDFLGGRYTLERLLGRGGMGEVWCAHDRQLDAKVAIKLLDLVDSPESREKQLARFLEEARAAAQIRSPHVVQVLDHGVDGEHPFIVMELLEGESLRDKLEREKRLSPLETFRVVQHASRALQRAHALGIVHRDLKPENLFIVHNDDEDVIKVLDFGIAKRADISRKSTGRNAIVGTPAYMSPEQGSNGAVDPRTDIWALGVIAFECLCGRCPFTGRGPAEIIINVASAPAPIPSETAPVPKGFDAWFAKACAKDRNARFASVTDQAAQLRAALGIEGHAMARDSGDLPIVVRTESVFAPTVALPNVTEEPLEAAPPPRSRTFRPLVFAGLAAVAIGTGAIIAKMRAPPPAPATIPYVDRVPTVGKPEALVEYRAALQLLHDASIASGVAHLEKAATIDPSLAQASLRFSIWEGSGNDLRRRHFSAAFDLRSSLDQHDRALLDILEAAVQNNDAAEAARRARAATGKFPNDPEIWWALAFYAQESHDGKTALDAADRALALDPTFALALWTKGNVLEDQGRIDELRKTLDECIRVSPNAASCVRFRAEQVALAGDCAAFEADARHLITIEPDGDRPYEYLMRALAARGDLDGAEEARRQFAARVAESRRPRLERFTRAKLELLRGNFDEADRLAGEHEAAVSGVASSELHADSWFVWLDVAEELGDSRRALDLATSFQAKHGVWTDHADSAERRRDPMMLTLSILSRAGKIDMAEYTRRRMEWHKAASVAVSGPEMWMAEYGRPANDPDLAKQAIDAASDAVRASRIAWAPLGKAYFIAGDAARAIELLGPATRSCLVLDDPAEHTRTHAYLGQALEKTGDAVGACGAYAVVIGRWGSAPHSKTADLARTRSRALGCK